MSSDVRRLLLAATAVAIQAAITVGSFGLLAREMPLEQVGRFGLYLAVTSLAMGIDGIRQTVVVAVATAERPDGAHVRHLGAVSLLAGLSFAVILTIAGMSLDSRWMEVLPVALCTFQLLALGPGLGVLEAVRGPHFAASLQSGAWSVAIGVGTFGSLLCRDVTVAAWAVLLAPLIIYVGVLACGATVRPSMKRVDSSRRVASHAMRSHVVTGFSGFVDKGAVASFGSAAALGLYTPLAELSARAGALAGGVANLFLRSEVQAVATATPHLRKHRLIVGAMVYSACTLGLITAIAAEPLLRLFLGQSDSSQVLTSRLLLACLTLNVGAHWSVVVLKARAQFDLYKPYTASLILALFAAPLLVTRFGIAGAGMVALVVRSADALILHRAGRLIGRRHQIAVLATTVLILLVAIFGIAQE
jgi:hypothetical protein